MPVSFLRGYKSTYRVLEIYIQDICNKVSSNFMQTREKLELTQISINKKMPREVVVDYYNGKPPP